MSVKIKGLDGVKKELDKTTKQVRNVGNKKKISYGELFPNSFISRFTNFKTIDEMFDKNSFKIESLEDLEAIPDAEWDNFIRENTKFDSWGKMQETAFGEWTSKKIGL